ncbi:MAG: hypothetical protein HY423_09595 [Candidatus Lambdaproteobacteria bacterium]|nr:hypothetical protein [Candidatus Lambdaproteobacteria bacterium]
MKFLNLERTIAVMQLVISAHARQPMFEQLQPFCKLHRYVLLYLSGIALGSMHLGELIAVAKSHDEVWGKSSHWIGLVHLSPEARRVLSIAKLDAVFRTYDTVDDALTAIA